MEFTAQQIADYLHGTVEGNPQVRLHDFAKIEEGRSGCLSFLANAKYEHYLYETASDAVLVNEDFRPRESVRTTLIRVPNAYAALAQLMQLVDSMKPQRKGVDSTAFVHPSVSVPEDCYIGAFAYVAEGASLGTGCSVYPHVYIGSSVSVGEKTTLYPHTTVYDGCRIGARCIIHAGAVTGADGFGFAPDADGYNKIPQMGNVIIEDDVEVGANTCIDRAVMGSTIVHRGVKLDNLVQIAHNCTVGSHTVFAAQVGMAGSSHVGEWCQFGGQVGLSGHIKVGDHVSLGGQTGLLSNVKSGSVLLGSPGMPVRDMLRTSVILPKLPDMSRRIDQLEKEISELKEICKNSKP